MFTPEPKHDLKHQQQHPLDIYAEQHVAQNMTKNIIANSAKDLRAKDSVKSFKFSAINQISTLDNLISRSAFLLLHLSHSSHEAIKAGGGGLPLSSQ